MCIIEMCVCMCGLCRPLLFKSVLQHLNASHQIFLQILLAFPLALQERDLSLQHTQTHTVRHDLGHAVMRRSQNSFKDLMS